MSKKKKLRNKLGPQLEETGSTALVVCVGKKCAPREASTALLGAATTYAAEHGAAVHVARFGCLGVCKKGPVVATMRARPGKRAKVRIEKRVDEPKIHALIDGLIAP